jgi:hypothetical protein
MIASIRFMAALQKQKRDQRSSAALQSATRNTNANAHHLGSGAQTGGAASGAAARRGGSGGVLAAC